MKKSNGGGIYEIVNAITGVKYIGSTKNLRARQWRHFWELKLGIHSNQRLLRSFGKHGNAAFAFHVLEEVLDQKNLLEREQHWIDSCDFNLLYNMSKTASRPASCKRSDATRKRISLALSGRSLSEKTKSKLSIAMKNLYLNGMVNPRKGKKHTTSAIAKLKESCVIRNKAWLKHGYHPRNKAVAQLILGDNQILCLYDSAIIASKASKANRTSICMACSQTLRVSGKESRRSLKTAGRYIWHWTTNLVLCSQCLHRHDYLDRHSNRFQCEACLFETSLHDNATKNARRIRDEKPAKKEQCLVIH